MEYHFMYIFAIVVVESKKLQYELFYFSHVTFYIYKKHTHCDTNPWSLVLVVFLSGTLVRF